MRLEPDVYGPNGVEYQNDDSKYDLSRIGIDVTEKGSGDLCRDGDWATLHWIGKLKDGRVVTDSRAEPGGLPKVFRLGQHEVFKCWDIALEQLQQGSKATLHCPSYYVWGGAFTKSPITNGQIPLHSDVDFDIEVVECNRTPTWSLPQQTQPVSTTMIPGKCMYLHALGGDHVNDDLVLSADTNDYGAWWPGKYLYVETKVKDDPSQQFFLDA